MKRLSDVLAAAVVASGAVAFTAAAFAGQEPYLATVGPDSGDLESPPMFTNPADPKRELGFYVSPKINQFTQHRCTGDGLAVGESFQAFSLQNATGTLKTLNQPEVCDTSGTTFGGFVFRGDWQARTTGKSQGSYRWRIALPKDPNGPMNLVLECGVLKPQQFGVFGFAAVEQCAGYTGEAVVGCSSTQDPVGSITPSRLPTLNVNAYQQFAPTTPIPLRAYQNPSNYASTVALDGSAASRIALKSCQDKTVVVALPAGETAPQLIAGDIIEVILNIPTANQLDIYCGRDSLKLQGIGEPNC